MRDDIAGLLKFFDHSAGGAFQMKTVISLNVAFQQFRTEARGKRVGKPGLEQGNEVKKNVFCHKEESADHAEQDHQRVVGEAAREVPDIDEVRVLLEQFRIQEQGDDRHDETESAEFQKVGKENQNGNEDQAVFFRRIKNRANLVEQPEHSFTLLNPSNPPADDGCISR